MKDKLRYQSKSVWAVRGTESKVAAKWANDGWELVAEDRGIVRTSLTFRRTRPPVPWQLVAASSAGLVALALVIGLVAAFTTGGKSSNPSPSASSASTNGKGQGQPSATSLPPGPPTPPPSSADPLTVATSPELAAVLALTDYCDPGIGEFAVQNADAVLEFDASISAIEKHGSYDTRYDILLAPGDAGTRSTTGPAFKFEDVGMADLKFSGEYPDAIGEDELLRVTAAVGSFSHTQCLFYLDPIETQVRRLD